MLFMVRRAPRAVTQPVGYLRKFGTAQSCDKCLKWVAAHWALMRIDLHVIPRATPWAYGFRRVAAVRFQAESPRACPLKMPALALPARQGLTRNTQARVWSLPFASSAAEQQDREEAEGEEQGRARLRDDISGHDHERLRIGKGVIPVPAVG